MAPAAQAAPGAALFCTECGGELPGPGEECLACPQLDARRRAVVARYSGQVAELRAIHADENAKALQDAAGRARALVTPVRAAVKTAEAAVTAAVAASGEPPAPADTARSRHRGADAGRRPGRQPREAGRRGGGAAG